MIGVEERDQNVDVKQRPASVNVIFAKMVYEIVRHDPATAREWPESLSRLPFPVGRSFPMRRESKPREVGKHGTHGPAFSAGALPGGLQNVVRDLERSTHNIDADTSNISCTRQIVDCFRWRCMKRLRIGVLAEESHFGKPDHRDVR
jgi:hypothetical protein